MEEQPLIDRLLGASAPNLDFTPRAGCRSRVQIEAQLLEEKGRIPEDPGHQNMVRCLMLLWNDHFEHSHDLAQEMHHQTGSLLHGILHRREGDFWNAKYWLSRVGAHPVNSRILEKLRQMGGLGALKDQILVRGNSEEWNPCRFVDVCSGVLTGGGSEPEKAALKLVQEAELRSLMEVLLQGDSTGKRDTSGRY